MAEEVIHEHEHVDRPGGMGNGLVIGLLVVVLLIVLFFVFGLGGGGSQNTPNTGSSIPDKVDVNVNGGQGQ